MQTKTSRALKFTDVPLHRIPLIPSRILSLKVLLLLPFLMAIPSTLMMKSKFHLNVLHLYLSNIFNLGPLDKAKTAVSQCPYSTKETHKIDYATIFHATQNQYTLISGKTQEHDDTNNLNTRRQNYKIRFVGLCTFKLQDWSQSKTYVNDLHVMWTKSTGVHWINLLSRGTVGIPF